MNITPFRIQDIKFSARETAVLYVLAGQALKDTGMSREEAKEYIAGLTPANILRLALGFEKRKRGGSRINAGRPKPGRPKPAKAQRKKPE